MNAQQRRETDRRRSPRGGRRDGDLSGFAPLVLVVDDDPARSQISEMILAKLHFAVTPADSVDKALSIMRALRPDVIVAGTRALDGLRRHVPATKEGRSIPIVEVPSPPVASDELISAVRRALAGQPV
jgi:PleD family two-component response regulator